MGINYQVGPRWVPSKLFQISRLLSNSLDNSQFKSQKKRGRKKKKEETQSRVIRQKGGPQPLQVKFQKLESLLQVQVELKNGEEKGEK